MTDSAPQADPLTRKAPKHLEVYRKIRARLDSGEFAVGTLLPTEDELCAEYKVTRYALREALGLLGQQQYIDRRRRAGTRVLGLPPKSGLRHLVGSRSELVGYAAGTTLKFDPPRLVQTDTKLARFLGCDELREWHLLQGVRVDTADRRPVGIVRIYIDASRATVAPGTDFGPRPIFEWLEETCGIHAHALSQDISAVLLTAQEAEIFGESAGAPGLQIVRRYFDDRQKIYLIAVTTHGSNDFVYNLRISLERGPS